MLSQRISRLIISLVRKLNTTPVVFANHYDVLEITPKATQNDIKSAYYKLSKVHHPDISSVSQVSILASEFANQWIPDKHILVFIQDEESAKKFRAITEAYEVLGNVKLKKMYDKGMLTRSSGARTSTSYHAEPEPTDPTLKFYKSRATRHVAPTMDGKIPIFDYDAWSQKHYGAVFQKSQSDKEFLRKKREKQIEKAQAARQEATIYLLFALTGLFLALVFRGKSDYDIDSSSRRKQTIPIANNSPKEETP